jgi:pteridine reductase
VSALEGRRALVTGASRRLGRAIAQRLAAEGADVAVHHRGDDAGARATAAAVEAAGRRAVLVRGDLADAAACERIAREAREALGGLDLLVNNAAVFRRTPLDEMTVEDFDAHLAVNARAVFALSLHAGRRMKSEGGGSIVNLACVSALRPWRGYVPYSASKAAVASLTKGFALALAPEVRVNAVAPGPILPAEGATPAESDRAVRATLLARWGAPSDVASAVVFLATSPYVTGVVLPVDGGRSIA